MKEETPIEYNGYPKPEPRPKKAPTPLKRTPLPTNPTPKQSAKARAYEAGKREKYSEADGPTICSGCGRNTGLSCSHLVARSHSFDLVDEATNHEAQCFACHDATESGRFFQLRNGLRLLEKLWGGLGENGIRKQDSAAHRPTDRRDQNAPIRPSAR